MQIFTLNEGFVLKYQITTVGSNKVRHRPGCRNPQLVLVLKESINFIRISYLFRHHMAVNCTAASFNTKAESTDVNTIILI